MRKVAWARFVLLTGLVLTMGASCSVAVSSRATILPTAEMEKYVVPGEVPEEALAITTCQNGRVVVHIRNQDSLPPLLLREIWEHEVVHVRQLSEHKDWTCEQHMMQQFSDPVVFMRNESLAACAQIRWAFYNAKLPGDPMAAMIHQAIAVRNRLANVNPNWAFPTNQVIAAFIRVCPFITVVEPREEKR